jgi:uncharacterized phiE125 gp8 family phage protein
MSQLLHPIAAPATEPVTVDEAKAHLRIDLTSGIEDAFLQTRIGAARSLLSGPEGYTKRQLVTASWRFDLPRFPAGDDPIVLPLPPLRDDTKVEYLDTSGVLQTWDPSKYQISRPLPTADGLYPEDAPRGRLYPAFGEAYPDTREVPDAVRVTFECGYGDQAKVPAIFKAALLLVIGDLYQRREESAMPQEVGIPIAAWNLLWGVRDRERWGLE